MLARAPTRPTIRRLGRAALLPFAALVVHQLRFALAFGGNAGTELARQGHSYLHSLVPWLVLLLALAAGGFLWALGRALGSQRTLPRYVLTCFLMTDAATTSRLHRIQYRNFGYFILAYVGN